MAILKCKMCGGDLTVEAGMTVAECEYCGTKQTVPSADNEKKLTLFGRANRLRFACEFDKAAGVYETIIADFPEEAEAYWGLVLCAYGIEYVDDPATGKKIPTCHRSSFESVMDDSNFEQALENADPTARAIYREEAKAIEELRKGIIEVSSKEEPYDIFICYKETDEKGDRTIDSVIAQDVYDALTDKGYRVFFSRITLEDKLGQEYEPYIFAALNSAKIMLAFGADYEYYNTVWVKNEWSRFLQLMTKDKSKHLIPCYKGIDAYDMPKEFAKLQAQDMGKVGAVQDLLRGIEKLLPRETQKEVVKRTVVMGAATNTAPLLDRAFMFLEDGKWDKADEFCEQVLNIDSRCAEAYLGKLMAELQVSKRGALAEREDTFEESDNYQKALRFGSADLAAELNGYFAQINIRKENARLDGIYKDAVKAMNSAYTTNGCETAIQMFESILQWKDSANRIVECNAKIEEIKAKEEADRLEREHQAEISRKKAEEKATRNKKIAAIVAPVVCAITAFIIVLNSVIIPNGKYNDALALMDAQQYTEAIAAFEAMDGYKDSATKIAECKYSGAIALVDAQQYTDAIAAFEAMNGYKDSIAKIEECNTLILDEKYNYAIALMDTGNIIDAYEELVMLNGYKDSREKAKSIFVKYTSEKLKDADVGDYITFGRYEQDQLFAGPEEIEWLVLDKQDNKVLVISKYGLVDKPYHTDYVDVTWETCTLRKWLNNDFVSSAFSAEEKAMIPTVTVSADKNPSYSTNPGNATQDQVFLLSVTEAYKYLPSQSARVCVGTAYTTYPEWCTWWLRSPGPYLIKSAVVNFDGSITRDDKFVDDPHPVRPAMWIDLSAV